jgi:uncharacterized protein with HEPN domain
VTGDELLDASSLRWSTSSRLVPTDKLAWDADERTPLAVERLGIETGNTAEEYRRFAHVDSAGDPWAELYEYRNRLARALPGDIDRNRVWRDTTTDIGRLLADLRAGSQEPIRSGPYLASVNLMNEQNNTRNKLARAVAAYRDHLDATQPPSPRPATRNAQPSPPAAISPPVRRPNLHRVSACSVARDRTTTAGTRPPPLNSHERERC